MRKEDDLSKVPMEFNRWVKKSLGVLSRISGDAENNEIEKILVLEGIESREAKGDFNLSTNCFLSEVTSKSKLAR